MGNRRSSKAGSGAVASADEFAAKRSSIAGDNQITESLARGLEVLRCFKDGAARYSNQELSNLTSLPKPTVSRLTYTLMALGYLTYDDTDGTYGLGAAVLELAKPLLAAEGLAVILRPAMRQLAEETGCSVALGRRAGLFIVYTSVVRGAHLVSLDIAIGHAVPLLNSAMGRAYLAALDRQERLALQRELTGQGGQSAAKAGRTVDAAVQSLQSVGYCQTLGELHPEVNAAAVPLRAPGREDLQVLMCGGPSYRLTPEIIRDLVGPRLAEIAARLSSSKR
ncbi:MAG: helix-turn-helix domain-containing protein [Rhizobiales bacterium]|nr:helix-turn-helix domain-containing protein [Hyphomicrobiales bacterium]